MRQSELDPEWSVKIVRICQTGSDAERKQAWDELSRALLPVITEIARREQRKIWFYANTNVADDAAMQAFESLYKNIGKITDATGLVRWITRVIQNKLRDMARKFEMRVQLTAETWLLDSPALHNYPSDNADLHAAIRALPDTQRQLVFDVFWRGISVEEIAKRDGCAVGAVRVQLRRTLQKELQPLLFRRGG